MHMKHYDTLGDALSDMVTVTSVNWTFSQRTNNLDGILRDHNDNPVQLDPYEFMHQAYYGNDTGNGAPKNAARYIFRGGKLLEADRDKASYAMS